MTDLRLILFDVDGTLVDSQRSILAAMQEAFAAQDRPTPPRAEVLDIVGLSLERAMAQLAPDASEAEITLLSTLYKQSYHRNRVARGAAVEAPLYPGARAALDRLAARDTHLLGVATGKSRRGLEAVIDAHGLTRHFLTRQVADDHPSKPNPSMILAAMDEMGVTPAQTVMIGDTSYDMDMARAAGVGRIAVSWGYHPPHRLQADHVIDNFDALDAALDQIWKDRA